MQLEENYQIKLIGNGFVLKEPFVCVALKCRSDVLFLEVWTDID